MERKMSRWGIGPVFAALSVGYAMAAVIISRSFYALFRIDMVPDRVLHGLGAAYVQYKKRTPCILPIGRTISIHGN